MVSMYLSGLFSFRELDEERVIRAKTRPDKERIAVANKRRPGIGNLYHEMAWAWLHANDGYGAGRQTLMHRLLHLRGRHRRQR